MLWKYATRRIKQDFIWLYFSLLIAKYVNYNRMMNSINIGLVQVIWNGESISSCA